MKIDETNGILLYYDSLGNILDCTRVTAPKDQWMWKRCGRDFVEFVPDDSYLNATQNTTQIEVING